MRCGKKPCQVCLNITETDSFISISTSKTYKINHQFNCSEKCLVYLLTCRVCFKQYIGQIVDEFRNKWSNYKSNDRKYLNRHWYFQECNFPHFNCDGHSGFLENVSKIFIDKASPSDPEKRESFWMQTLKTIVPRNLNVLVSSGWPNIDCHKFSVIAFFTFGTRSSCKD